MTNRKPLPAHLADMTQDKWDKLTPAERARLADNSELHPMLIGLEGKRVTISPPREYGRSTFIVGKTTGWRPAHLAMRANAHGSSDIIRANEPILSVKIR